MPTQNDLVGLGMSPFVAAELGQAPTTLAGTGTSQATAATLLSRQNIVTASASQTGVIIPSAAKVGSPWYFFNPNATGVLIYAPASTAAVGATTLNGAASTTPLTLAQNKMAILFQFANGKWGSVLTA